MNQESKGHAEFIPDVGGGTSQAKAHSSKLQLECSSSKKKGRRVVRLRESRVAPPDDLRLLLSGALPRFDQIESTHCVMGARRGTESNRWAWHGLSIDSGGDGGAHVVPLILAHHSRRRTHDAGSRHHPPTTHTAPQTQPRPTPSIAVQRVRPQLLVPKARAAGLGVVACFGLCCLGPHDAFISSRRRSTPPKDDGRSTDPT